MSTISLWGAVMYGGLAPAGVVVVKSLLPEVFSSIYKVCSGSRLLSKSRELLQFAARSRGAGCEG